MTAPIRVAVTGYGVIGKRVADAVRAMPDMHLVGVADVATDWRIRTAAELGIPVFAAGESARHAMVSAGIPVLGTLEDLLGQGVPGMSTADTRTYLEFVADQRLVQLGLPKRYGSRNPFGFMELQDVQELTNFFERTVAAYQVGVEGNVAFDEDF